MFPDSGSNGPNKNVLFCKGASWSVCCPSQGPWAPASPAQAGAVLTGIQACPRGDGGGSTSVAVTPAPEVRLTKDFGGALLATFVCP